MPGTRPGMTIKKTAIPRKRRKHVRLKPGDTLRYRMAENSVWLD
jgi:hypothetical protein